MDGLQQPLAQLYLCRFANSELQVIGKELVYTKQAWHFFFSCHDSLNCCYVSDSNYLHSIYIVSDTMRDLEIIQSVMLYMGYMQIFHKE